MQSGLAKRLCALCPWHNKVGVRVHEVPMGLAYIVNVGKNVGLWLYGRAAQAPFGLANSLPASLSAGSSRIYGMAGVAVSKFGASGAL